jgi:hypothetical protein
MGKRKPGAITEGNTDAKTARKVSPASLANLAPAWQPGQSGNPAGRPKSSHEAQVKLRDLALEDVPELYAALRKNALDEGDTGAIRLALQLAGAMPATQVEAKVEEKRANPYTAQPTDALLAAATSSTLAS